MLILAVFTAVILAIPLVVLWSLVRPLRKSARSGTDQLSLRTVYLSAGVAFVLGALVLAWLYSWGSGLDTAGEWLIFAAVVLAAGLWAAAFAIGVFVVRGQMRANRKVAR